MGRRLGKATERLVRVGLGGGWLVGGGTAVGSLPAAGWCWRTAIVRRKGREEQDDPQLTA
jgi:hypothetical protein